MVIGLRRSLLVLAFTWPGALFAAPPAPGEPSLAVPSEPSVTPPDAAVSAGAPEASEQVAAEAQRAFAEGLEFLRGEQWAQAEASFRHSLRLVSRPSTQYNLALVLFKQRRARESWAIIRQILDSPAAERDARYREYAGTLKPLVLGQLAALRLTVQPADAELRIDGELVRERSGAERVAWLDAGTHSLEVRAPGYSTRTFDLQVEMGGKYQESVRLVSSAQHAPAPPVAARRKDVARRSEPSPLGPYITIGAGAALLAGGLVTYALAKSKDNDFVDKCPSLELCPRSLQGQQEDVNRLRTLSYVLLGAGVAVTSGGVAWRLLSTSSSNGQKTGQAWMLSASGRF